MDHHTDWIRQEAAFQGLVLTEEDLQAIARMVARTRAALAAVRPGQPEGLESPALFLPPGSPPGSVARP